MVIALRPDFDARRLRATAYASKDAGQTRRLLALAVVYEGATRTEAARIGGLTLQIGGPVAVGARNHRGSCSQTERIPARIS